MKRNPPKRLKASARSFAEELEKQPAKARAPKAPYSAQFVFAYGALYIGTPAYLLTGTQARELAAWLLKAAVWIEQENKGAKRAK